MAVYHMDIKAHSRSLHTHAIALSSYRSGQRLLCDADGKVRHCRRGEKSAVLYTCLINNRDLSRERLWNKVEKMEKRKDAVVAREMELALPVELSEEQQIDLSVSMGERIAQRYNCAVDVAVHYPDRDGDDRNFHVHLLFTPRAWAGNNVNEREFEKRKYRDLNRASAKEEVLFWRNLWEEKVNQALEKCGLEERVSSLSCEAQGKMKKYEHFDFRKYQYLRRINQLEDAKRASRLGLEIRREELELEDLVEIRNELIFEKEKLLAKEKTHAGFREENSRSGRGEPLAPETESGDYRETGKLSTDSDKSDSGSIPERSHEQSGTGPENSQREQSLLTGTGGVNGRSSGELEAGAETTAHEGAGGLGRRTWDGIKETAKKLWEYLFKSEFLDIINPFKKKKAPTPKPEPEIEPTEAEHPIQELPENYQNHIPVFNDLKRSRTQQLIEQLDPSSIPDSNELNWARDFFMEHIRNDYKKEQYQETFNNLTEKINLVKNCSNEVTLLKLLDREAKENSLVKFVELREEQKECSWLGTLNEVLEFREQFFRAFIKDPEKRELYQNTKEDLILNNNEGQDYLKESEILKQLDNEAYNRAVTEINSIISRPDDQPYNYSSLSERSYFFDQHVKDERMQDEYKYIQNVLVEKRRYREDCSLELEFLRELDKIAKEAATPQREEKQEVKIAPQIIKKEEIQAEPAQPTPPPKPKVPSWKDKYSPKEVNAIEAEINRLEWQLKDNFIPFNGLQIPKVYQSCAIAQKNNEKVIVDFYTEDPGFGGNLWYAVRNSSVEGISKLNSGYATLDNDNRGYVLKSFDKSYTAWEVFEIHERKDRSLGEQLQTNFQDAKVDDNLLELFTTVFNIHRQMIDNQIKDLKRLGIEAKKHINLKYSITSTVNEQKQNHKRGI